MALTIFTQISGQQATATATYCYLYEPLRVSIDESDLTATRLYVNLQIIDTTNSANIIETITNYGVYDINPGVNVVIDLMKLAEQYHDADVLNFSNIDEVVAGWQAIVSKYKYNFQIYSDKTTTPVSVVKLPLLGVRDFETFTPTVNVASPLTEFDLVGASFDDNWNGYFYVSSTLVTASLVNATPTIVKVVPAEIIVPCAGMLVWKSKFGGWSTWGFSIKTSTPKSKYTGNLVSNMFESTLEIGGNPFVPVNYTGITMERSINLKSLGLSSLELEAVSGINSSPAVYYVKDDSGKMELMRLSSASTPLSNLANGGDFSASLSSISETEIKTK
jgi:hypothetical protein